MVRRVAVPHVLHLVDPIAEWQREFPLDQVNHAFLPTAGAFGGLRIDEILRRARHVTPVGLTDSRKPCLVPGRCDVVQRLVALVADSPGHVERLVKGRHGLRVMQLAGVLLRFIQMLLISSRRSEHQQILAAQLGDREINLEVVTIELDRGQILVQQIQQLVILAQKFPGQFDAPWRSPEASCAPDADSPRRARGEGEASACVE